MTKGPCMKLEQVNCDEFPVGFIGETLRAKRLTGKTLMNR